MIRASSNSVTLLGDEHLEVRNRLAVRSVVAADGLAVAVAGSAGGLEVVEAEEQLGVLGAGENVVDGGADRAAGCADLAGVAVALKDDAPGSFPGGAAVAAVGHA